MTSDPLSGVVQPWTLDAYLTGTTPPPAASGTAFDPLHLAIAAACPRRSDHRACSGYAYDVGLGLAWRAAYDIDLRLRTDSKMSRRHGRASSSLGLARAEAIARVQASALLTHLLKREAELEHLTCFDVEGFSEQVEALASVRDLAGVVALCLAEAGVAEGRRYVARRITDILQAASDDAHLYIAASVGCQVVQHIGTWQPGGPPLRWLAAVLKAGAGMLGQAKAGPEPVPAWAEEAMEKAAKDKAERERIASGPSLLVLASASHLPGATKDGESRPGALTGSTPRQEFAPIAGRRLVLVAVPYLPRVKQRLVREFPDDAAVIEAILAPLAGKAFAQVAPVLLLGPPGTGKSRLARRIGEELGLKVTVYGCAAVADGSFVGTSRQWSTGRACVPLQAVKRAMAASVLIVLDEISRAGTRADNGRLVDGVLALTERETARAYQDPYLECPVDLSAVSYIATANTRDGLDPALLSRFRVLEMGPRTAASLPGLARSIVADLRVERGLDKVWLPDLSPSDLALVGEHWKGGSVRVLQRLVEAAVDSHAHALKH